MTPPTPPELWSPEFWSAFFTSAGFGGMAALLAALIALASAVIRNRTDKDIADDKLSHDAETAQATLTHQQTAADKLQEAKIREAEAEHWWTMFTWTLDNTAKVDLRTGQILLRTLHAQAPTDAEREMVAVAVSMMVERAEGTHGPGTG